MERPIPGEPGPGPFRPLRLVAQRGPDAGRAFIVGRAGATAGRGEGNTAALSDPAVSRRHARVAAHDAGLLIVDAGSWHGTWLNGRRLAHPCPLRPGDTVRLGDSTLRSEPAPG